MSLLLLLPALLLLIGVAFLVSIRVPRSPFSHFELTRRQSMSGGEEYGVWLRREQLAGLILSMRTILALLFGFGAAYLLVLALGPLFGTLLSVVLAVFGGFVTGEKRLSRFVNGQYGRVEPMLLRHLGRHRSLYGLVRFIRVAPPAQQIHSAEELRHLIETATYLSESEQRALLSALASADRVVRSVMIPRRRVLTIDEDETLGPLVINELHATGHRAFPVTHGDIAHVSGFIELESLTNLSDKRTHAAKEVMDRRISFISDELSLLDAIALFLHEESPLFIVMNEREETVGIVTMKDVIDAFVGGLPNVSALAMTARGLRASEKEE